MAIRSLGSFLSAGIMASWLSIVSPCVWAQPAVQLDLPAQPLVDALRLLGKRADTNILIDLKLVGNLQATAVKGMLTVDQALAQMLAGTNLRYRFLNERTVVLESVKDGVGKTSDVAQVVNLRLAQGGDEVASMQRENSSPQSGEGTDEDKGPSISEIVVTAQKREQRALDVPISIFAMSADELRQRKAVSLDDLSLAVPGLSIQSSGSNVRQIMLRGISSPVGGSSLVGLYLDEASATSDPFRQLDLRTYDLERVEVLRGPQGTLYGEGSVGGTIRFITKNPVLDKFSMNTDVAALFTQDGEPGGRVQGMLNVPLIENELGLRIAGTFDHQGGWMDQPAADRKDFNDQNLANVRIKGLWRPAPQFAVNAMAVIHRNDAPPSQGEEASGTYTQVFNLTTAPSVQDNYDLYNLTLTYDFPAVRLLSTTSYVNQDKEVRNLGTRRQFTPPGQPQSHSLLPELTRSSEVFTDELRLTSIGFDSWNWTIGGLYRRNKFDDGGLSIFGLPGPLGTPLPNAFPFQTYKLFESWALFGDVSYDVTDRLTLGTGLRYFEDDQEFTRVSGGVAGPIQTTTFDTLNPRFYVQYKLADNLNSYASASKGFRSGGFNSAVQPTYDPENVWTYELGTKMYLAGGRFGADMAIFYSDYTDYQVIGIPPLVPPVGNVISNAGDAKIKGVEWALTWRPMGQWSLSFNGNYVDSEFVEINAASATHAVGDRLDFFPEYSYTLSAERAFTWSGRSGFARLDYNQQGRMTFRNRSIGPWYYDESDVIEMLNLNMGLAWSDDLSLGIFAQNVLNDRGYSGAGSIEDNASRPRPRTYGIEFSFQFD